MLASYRKWIIIGAVCIAMLLFFVYQSCSKPPVSPVPQQSINDVKAALEEQYKTQLVLKDNEIKESKNKLFLSEAKYQVLSGKYDALKKEKADVKPPQTDQELRDRFAAIGFPTLPIK